MKQPEPGDYVLATKYDDGDPQDHWAIGFYSGKWEGRDRHDIVNHEGKLFRGNGFRRVKKISGKRGDWMLEHAHLIEQASCSVWHFARCKMDVFDGISQSARQAVR